MQRAVTLKDVAAAAGVSVSTVSRVLDERLPQSRTTTAERVRHAAEELGYFRNITASSLRRGDTGTVGVLVAATYRYRDVSDVRGDLCRS